MQEVRAIREVLDAVQVQGATIMLDIDNTLLQPVGTYVGSDQWYAWQCQLIDSRSPFRMCETKADLADLLHELHCRVPFSAVEEHTEEFLALVKQAAGRLVLVSARSEDMREVTRFQLTSAFGLGEFECDLLLCGGRSKGGVLRQYLRAVEPADRPAPPRVFVDDSLYHVVDVKAKLGGEVTCFLYLGAKACVERFRKAVLEGPGAAAAQEGLLAETRSWLASLPCFTPRPVIREVA